MPKNKYRMFSRTREQAMEHNLKMTEAFLAASADPNVYEITRTAMRSGQGHKDPYEAVMGVLARRGTSATFDRSQVKALARWLFDERSYSGDIDLSVADDDMPEIDDGVDVTMLNAIKFAMRLTHTHPTAGVLSPAITFNRELADSLETLPDGSKRLREDSRLGQMLTSEYNAERGIVSELSRLWEADVCSAFDICQTILIQLGTKFRFDPKAYEPKEEAHPRAGTDTWHHYVNRRIYAGGGISRGDIIFYGPNQSPIHVSHVLDDTIAQIWRENKDDFARDRHNFSIRDEKLCSADGETVYIDTDSDGNMTVTDALYLFLTGLDTWSDVAMGTLERTLARLLSDIDDRGDEGFEQEAPEADQPTDETEDGSDDERQDEDAPEEKDEEDD